MGKLIGQNGRDLENDLAGVGGSYELNLTTIGSSGAATYNAGTDTLNIPIYTGGGGATVTADSGLTKTLDNIRLGGLLLEDASLNGNGGLYNFSGFQLSSFAMSTFSEDVGNGDKSSSRIGNDTGSATMATSIRNAANTADIVRASIGVENNFTNAAFINSIVSVAGVNTSSFTFGVNYMNWLANGLSVAYPTTYGGGATQRTLPISVNGTYADTSGNITIAAGGGGYELILTTTGTGAATYNAATDTLNIPTPAGAATEGYTCLNDITYANLLTAIANSTLTVGCYYRITDFQTVHTINTINGEAAATRTGAINPIVIRAVAVNKLAEFGDCGLYKGDTIYYKVDNNTYMPGSTKGYIYRRVDHKLNISLPLDWKEVRYRRYALAIPGAWAAGTAYTAGNLVHHNGGQIYKALRASTGVSPDIVANNAHNDYDWVYLGASNGQHLADPSQFGGAKLGGITVTVDLASFTDYPIFDSVGFGLGTYANIYMDDQANTFSDQFYFGDNIYKAFNNVFLEFSFFHNVRMDAYTKFAGNTFKGIDHTYNGASKFFHSSLSSHSSFTDNYCFNVDMYDLSLENESSITRCTVNGFQIGDCSILNQSSISDITCTKDASIDYSNLVGRSFISGHIAGGLESLLLNNSTISDTYYTFIWYNTFNHSRVVNWSHTNNKGFTFKNNTFYSAFMNGVVATEFGPIMRTANYTKEIVRRPDGVHRLKYLDNTDTTIVTVLTA